MSEPIKRYTVSASVPVCDCGALIACRFDKRQDDGGAYVLHADHLAALESAKAEAFRLGQEEMRMCAVGAAACPHCNGTGSFLHQHYTSEGEDAGCEDVQCCNPQEHAAMIDRILNLPLKDKP